ncbi:hypothetical protein IE81DRAFT_169219 [Ceraceosorus guamensis]|uniref:Uncharacterized protein n=1 Tax=Ceraceosorus guamensis TaxID=1522189 RepID=A0A316VVE9_9BASI|nr:hypothetical protein IE81DRAFT_169219 [Ceraceosorus guamensis]PWN41617.1 hypothetical protein IE81DRAFT_169219 [Ceraceosorus guamensis]
MHAQPYLPNKQATKVYGCMAPFMLDAARVMGATKLPEQASECSSELAFDGWALKLKAATLNAQGDQRFQQSKNWRNVERVALAMQTDGTGEANASKAVQAKQMLKPVPDTSAASSSAGPSSHAGGDVQDDVTFVRIQNSTGKKEVMKSHSAAGGGDKEIVFTHIKEGKGQRYSNAQWTPFKADPDKAISSLQVPPLTKRFATGSPLLGQTPSKQPGVTVTCPSQRQKG